MTNLETVQTLYAAFGRGDVPAILALLSEDIAWEYQPTSTDVPWLEPRRGHQEVIGFFQILATELEIKKFVPNAILAGGNRVVALCDFEAVVRRTQRTFIEVDEPHVWTFDDAGKVARFRHAADTHAQHLAWSR